MAAQCVPPPMIPHLGPVCLAQVYLSLRELLNMQSNQKENMSA